MKAEFVPEGYKADTECEELAEQIRLLEVSCRRSPVQAPSRMTSSSLHAKDPAPKSTRVSLDEDPASRRLNGKSSAPKILWRDT